MKRNIAPILRKRSKSASASKIIQNKENLNDMQQQLHVQTNNRCQSSKAGSQAQQQPSSMVVASGPTVRSTSQQNEMRQQPSDRGMEINKSKNVIANQQRDLQIPHAENINAPSANKNSSSTKNSNHLGSDQSPFIQRNNFMASED